MNIISNDYVLKEMIENNILNYRPKKESVKYRNKFRNIQANSTNNESNISSNISFFSEIPNCLKNYGLFHGCGQSPMNNVISLIAGICLFINSKKLKINFIL